ncbi:MAG: hypothetical protein WDO19_30065 [Bacteroidota bacterium]
MKGLIFMVIVTLVVLASFARPDKESSSSSLTTPSVSTANYNRTVQDSSIVHKQGS